LTPVLQCPACGQPAMSVSRKLFLGPAVAIACVHCGQRVSVAWTAMLAIIPFVAMILLLPVLSWPLRIASWLLATAFLFWYHTYRVPLVRR
jgi:hypothetical protein